MTRDEPDGRGGRRPETVPARLDRDGSPLLRCGPGREPILEGRRTRRRPCRRVS